MYSRARVAQGPPGSPESPRIARIAKAAKMTKSDEMAVLRKSGDSGRPGSSQAVFYATFRPAESSQAVSYATFRLPGGSGDCLLRHFQASRRLRKLSFTPLSGPREGLRGVFLRHFQARGRSRRLSFTPLSGSREAREEVQNDHSGQGSRVRKPRMTTLGRVARARVTRARVVNREEPGPGSLTGSPGEAQVDRQGST